MDLDSTMLSALHGMIDMYEEPAKTAHPSRVYVSDHRAMNATQADVKEYPNSCIFTVHMPGLKPDQITVQIEEPNMLIVFGERKLDKEKEEREGVKYLIMERRFGKFLETFMLPDNANPEAVSAVIRTACLRWRLRRSRGRSRRRPRALRSKLVVELMKTRLALWSLLSWLSFRK